MSQFRGGNRGGRGRGRGRGGRPFEPPQIHSPQSVPAPSSEVRQIEDKIVNDQKLAIESLQISASTTTDIVQRPGYGTFGRPVTLWANYFQILPSKDQTLFRYSVSVVSQTGEDIKGKKLGRCVQLLLEQLPHSVSIATDYRSNLISHASLGIEERQFEIPYTSEANAPSARPAQYIGRVKYTGTFTIGELLDYLVASSTNHEQVVSKDELIQAVNIVVGHGFKAHQGILVKKNNYFASDTSLIRSSRLVPGLQALQGFFMSVRAATSRILLNVQVKHLAVFERLPLVELLYALNDDLNSWHKVSTAIRGLVVTLTHLNNRVKKICGLPSPRDDRQNQHPPKNASPGASANTLEFWYTAEDPPRYMSVNKYFLKTYGALSNPKAPVVNVGSTDRPIYIPAEKCIVKMTQPYNMKLSPRATASMIDIAVRDPGKNAKSIVSEGMNLLMNRGGVTLEEFKLEIGKSLITVNGRVLDEIAVRYGNKKVSPRRGEWNMRQATFSKAATVSRWGTLWIRINKVVHSFRETSEVDLCRDGLATVMRSCGMQVMASPGTRVIDIFPGSDPSPTIKDALRGAKDKGMTLIVVVLPTEDSSIYNAVKRLADVEFGIHTVGVVASKFYKGFLHHEELAWRKKNKVPAIEPLRNRPNDQYLANVALKINLKLGGHNQFLDRQHLGFIADGKTMLVGLDVTHPSPGSVDAAPSVASIVASTNGHLAQWPADIRLQEGRKEMVEALKDMFKSRLKLWQKLNKVLPEGIIMYRDGVSEGQYSLVKEQEIPQLRAACQELYPATDTEADKPYLTVIICGKRHNTRFYPTNMTDADEKTGCTKNGTVVDRGVTESHIWDFYLQAHAALKGTPRSAHYVVVHDEIFRRRAVVPMGDKRTKGQVAADNLEHLTHAISHLFGRATKAVSLCPPAYYADLVCDRARRWLSRLFEATSADSDAGHGPGPAQQANVTVHADLKDTMFYI